MTRKVDESGIAVPQALCAALGGVGALLVLVRQAAYGPGLTRDSVRYVAGARNLLDGNGLAAAFGSPEQGGPLFTLLLAFAGSFGPEVIDAARYVNAAAFGVTIIAAAAWLRSRIRSPALVIWAAGAAPWRRGRPTSRRTCGRRSPSRRSS